MMGRGLQMDRQDWNGKADILGRGFISNSGSKEFCIGRNTGSSEAIDTKRTYITQKILDCHQIESIFEILFDICLLPLRYFQKVF